MSEIKDARLAAGLSRSAMSERMQIPVRTIEDWESGKRNPPDYVKRLIIKELAEIKKEA